MKIEISDVTKQIGIVELTQLTDLDNTGELNINVFNDAVDESISYINSLVRIPDNDKEVSYNLKKIVIDEIIYNLRGKNSLITDSLTTIRNSNIDKLKQESVSKNIESNSNFGFKHKKRFRYKAN